MSASEPWITREPDGSFTAHWPEILRPTWPVSHELLVEMIARHNEYTAALNALIAASDPNPKEPTL